MSSSEQRYNLSTAALYVGLPVLVGASCYYLYSSRNSKSSPKGSSSDKTKKILTPLEQVKHQKTIGNQFFSRKQYEQAIEHYNKAIELSQDTTLNISPDDLAIFFQNRAAAFEALERYNEVIQDCTTAIEHKKSYIKPYIRRAKAYEKLEDYDKAMVDAFSANLLEKFQNQTSMMLTENIVKASSKAKAAEAMKTRTPIWTSNQAIKSYFSAFTLDPLKDKLNGEIIKNSDQLQPLLDEAMKPENDNDPMSLLTRGSCLSLMGDMKAAQIAFDKLLELSDSECSPRIKANALIKKSAIVISDPSNNSSSIEKDLELVFELLGQASKLDPENPDVPLHKAQALTLAEKLDEAITTLDAAIELKKDFHSAIAQKLYIEFKFAQRDGLERKLKETLEKFENAIKEYPESIDLLQMYSQVLTEMTHLEKADQLLLKIAKMDPTDGSVLISRALLSFHLKSESDEVATLIAEALKLDPKIIFAYEILGSILSQKGKIDEAIKLFETSLLHCQSETDYARCYSLLDSARSQKKAAELLGM